LWAFKPIQHTRSPSSTRITPLVADRTAARTQGWTVNEIPSTPSRLRHRRSRRRSPAAGVRSGLPHHTYGSCGRHRWKCLASPRHPRTDGARYGGRRPPRRASACATAVKRARLSRSPNSKAGALSSDASQAPADEVQASSRGGRSRRVRAESLHAESPRQLPPKRALVPTVVTEIVGHQCRSLASGSNCRDT